MKRRYVITSIIAVGLLAASAVPILATSEDGPPTDPGEPPEFMDGGGTAQAGAEGSVPEGQFGAASVTTGGTTYDSTQLTKFIPGSALVVGSIDPNDVVTTSIISGTTCVSPASTSSGTLTEGYLPVELPDGALMTGVSFFGWDKDTSQNMAFRIHETEFTFAGLLGGSNSQTTSTLATGDSNDWSAALDAQSTFVAIPGGGVATGNSGFFAFGTSQRFYTIQVEMDNPSLGDQRFCGAEVFYQVPTTGDNQTFTPLEPCAIFDSRPGQGGTGIFAGEETRTVTVTGDTSGVGGAGDCGINTAATSIQLNILVLSPTGVGTLKAWAAGASEPNGLVAYTGSVDRWNGASVVPIASNDQISIKTQTSGAHVRLVVTGYYSPVSNMGN